MAQANDTFEVISNEAATADSGALEVPQAPVSSNRQTADERARYGVIEDATERSMSATSFDLLRIGIASPQDIRSWSRGEVKKPETINYRTFKPERDGLFCERIFGPTKDMECSCGKYKKSKFRGVICDRCGVEVTRSKVRRVRMGHVELAAPVAHLWYVKGVPSPMALLLDMSPRFLERVLYFSHWVVTRADQGMIAKQIEDIRGAVQEEMHEIDASCELDRKRAIDHYQELKLLAEQGEEVTREELDFARKHAEETGVDAFAEEKKRELQESLGLLAELEARKLLTDAEYRGLMRLMDTIKRKLGNKYEGMFEAGIGAAAIKKLLENIDLEKESRTLRKVVQETAAGAKRGRLIKRLEITEAFRKSKNRPEWMILDVIPVMPPELRPMVQLDGGRFATSDLNDLYRRIINRNNRLKRITEILAPESIINHEKRLLQESVDALIDNTRRQRPVTGSSGRALKSLSDMLKGKEGRFRKNLLGKRVDYSGRSVIVVGPGLRLNQCGLPKDMALELFKPFVMKRLVQKGFTTNIKTARRMIDRLKPEVWDALEEVISEHPVLLNRAPTLHRLGIQAFEPQLVDGKAIQVHPLVCPSFNADFDGDQMAVHVPLFPAAQAEARILMMSTNNLFSPRDGAPAMSPAYDMVLGCYYMTMQKRGDKAISALTPEEIAALPRFASASDAIAAQYRDIIGLQDTICVRHPAGEKKNPESTYGDLITTAGRLIFNEIVPDQLGYINEAITKKTIGDLVGRCHEEISNEACILFLDAVKDLGFHYGTKSGVSISMNDINVTSRREAILDHTEETVRRTNKAYEEDPLSMTPQERERMVLGAWIEAAQKVSTDVLSSMDKFNPFFMMANSGARGSSKQISQIVGMRGLMMDPSGRFIEDLPVKSNFREGLKLHEYFVSTHGARKGLADTALRTADAGYLTRRLVDVSQDVIVRADDCGTDDGLKVRDVYEGDETYKPGDRSLLGRRLAEPVRDPETKKVLFDEFTYITEDVLKQITETLTQRDRVRVHTVVESLRDRILGCVVCEDVIHPTTGEVLVSAGDVVDHHKAREVENAGVLDVTVRSVLTCHLGRGVCAKCYGQDLASDQMVEIGEAVGIIAAQSIGEPGTQLTMRTFHLGGVAQGTSLTGVANVKKARQQALQELRNDIDKGNLHIGGTTTEQKREIQRYLKVLEATVGGLLRVVELFEARKPKGEAITTDIDGTVVAIIGGGRAEIMDGVKLNINPDEAKTGVRKVVEHATLPIFGSDTEAMSKLERGKITGQQLVSDVVGAKGKVIAKAGQTITDKLLDQIISTDAKEITIRREFAVPYRGNLDVKVGEDISAGDTLTKGPRWPQDVLAWRGIKGVAEYLVQEVQKVYQAQGIAIHDKHIQVIVRQMLRKRRVKDPGDTELMPGRLVDWYVLEEINNAAVAEGGSPATADVVLLGITESALSTESFLSAASFQKTTKVLTEAATRGKVDTLDGLKENVIIGRLIPAGTGLQRKLPVEVKLDEAAYVHAKKHADVMGIMEPPKREREAPVNMEDLLPVGTKAAIAEADEAEMNASGLSVQEGESDMEEDIEPTPEDLLAALTIDAAEGDLEVDEDALLNPEDE
jgi:DNA-directed RNA polymerase subunit beta'